MRELNKRIVFVPILPILLLVATLLQPSIAQSTSEDDDSWPTWRHDPENTGFHTGTAPNTNHLNWTKSFGEGGGATRGGGVYPAATGYGKIYIGDDRSGVFYAIDENTGNMVWNHTLRAGGQMFTPTVAYNTVYVFSAKSKTLVEPSNTSILFALDQATGEIQWQQDIPAPPSTIPSCPSINVADDRLFIAESYNTVYCVNASSGTTLWRRDLPRAGYVPHVISHPAVADGRVFLGQICLNENDGSTIWNVTINNLKPRSRSTNFPALSNGKVFIAAEDTMFCLEQSDGSVSWSKYLGDVGGIITLTPPAVAYDRVFVASTDGNLYCLDERNGEVLWKQFVASGTIMRQASTPVVADNKIYLNNGGITCLDVNDGAVIWSYDTAGPSAQPLISNGKVVVTLEHDPEIYVFGQTTSSDQTMSDQTSSDQTFWYYIGGTIIVVVISVGLFFAWRTRNKTKKANI